MLNDEVTFAQRFKETEKLMKVVAKEGNSYYAKDLLRRWGLVLTDKNYRALFFEHAEEDTLRNWLNIATIFSSFLEFILFFVYFWIHQKERFFLF